MQITIQNNLFAREYRGLVNELGEGSIKHANITVDVTSLR